LKRLIFLVLLANLATMTALAFVYPEFMIAPGPLVKGHTERTTDCFACHQAFAGTPARKCTACHKLAEIGLQSTDGKPIAPKSVKLSFHQKLVQQDCVACHSDHEGVRKYRTGPRFTHGLLEPAVRQQCDGCHRAPIDTLHAKITGNCQQCHTDERWKPATFDHDKHFQLDRDHNVKCVVCHTNNDYSKYTCYGCHAHTPQKIRSKHLEEGIRDFENCVKCHRSAHEKPHRDGGEREREGRNRRGRDRD
jgi:hypothetical protein